MSDKTPPNSLHFEDKGGRRLRRTLADPDHAQRVAEIREAMREMDRSGMPNYEAQRPRPRRSY